MSYLNPFYKNEGIAQFSEIVEILLFFFSKFKNFSRTSYSVWKSGILKLSRSISKADIFTSHARAEIKK